MQVIVEVTPITRISESRRGFLCEPHLRHWAEWAHGFRVDICICQTKHTLQPSSLEIISSAVTRAAPSLQLMIDDVPTLVG